MFKLARFLKPYRKQVILGPIFKLVEAIFELIVPLVMARVIDIGVKTGDTGYVLRMGGLMVLLGVIGLCSTLVCQRFAAQASQGFGTVVRKELFHKINELSHAEVDRFGTASLITRLTSDVNQLQLAVAMLIRLVVRAPFLVIGSIVMAMGIDLRLSLVFLAVTPVIAVTLWLIMSRSVPYYQKVQQKLDQVSKSAAQHLAGARVIRAFNTQKTEHQKETAASDALTDMNLKVGRLSMLLNPLTSVILNLAVAAIVWFGGSQVNAGALTQGQIVAFVGYLNQILLALIVVANLVVIFTKAAASASRVNEVFETSPSVVQTAREAVAPVPGAPKVEFSHVTFAYESGIPVLIDLDFSVLPGQTVGIIGGTGSGKSSLVNLIPRYYDVSSGEIRVDGVPVKDYPFSQLRQKVSLVPQKAVLFTGTIQDNLRFKKPDASPEEISRAITIAQCREFIDRLPGGLETPVSESGKNLSGGQKQRLTIARALVGELDILILDDSSSALDYATDAALRQALARDLPHATVFVISQRASSIRHADTILVLDDGFLVGQGTHEELLSSCQVYREICRSQGIEKEAAV